MKSKNILFFGSDNFSLPTLVTLAENGYEVAGVVTKPDSRRGRGQNIEASAVKQVAEGYSLPVLQPEKLDKEFIERAKGLRAACAVVVSYGKFIPDELLELFGGLVLNIHPSLLPKYRGPSPIEAAILNGEKQTGVTLMQISSAMDAGPIYAQTTVPLTGQETAPLLYEQLAAVGAGLILENIDKILAGKLSAREQDHSKATITELLKKEDGKIDWQKSASEIERQVRAYLSWPGSTAELAQTQVIITNARVAEGLPQEELKPGNAFETENKEIAVQCGQGYLVISKLKPAGKREMTAQEFLNGRSLD